MQETTKTNSPSLMWLIGWVLVSFFSIMLGAASAFALAYIGSGGFGAPPPESTPPNSFMVILSGFMILIPGITLGGCQSLLIKNLLGNQIRWILVTLIGFTLGSVISLSVDFFAYELNLWFWIILSLFTGISQWSIMPKRAHTLRSYYWILANIIQGLLAGILGKNWIIEGAFYWGLGSIITGTTLIWMLSNNQHTIEDK